MKHSCNTVTVFIRSVIKRGNYGPCEQRQETTTRTTHSDDGKEKIFRDSAVVNLVDFFGRFKHLNVRSNDDLDSLVEQAQRIVRNVKPQELRENQNLRQRIAGQLAGVQSQVEGLLVDKPRRNILRRK